MTLDDIKKLVQSDTYSFLRTNEHLGKNIILLGLGGSYAYGTNIETSDLDIRGCTLNSKKEILTNCRFEQFVNEETDTTIYSLNKLVSLLSNCNPNTIEILGLKPEHYLYLSDIGRELLKNKEMFLSKKCIGSFGGYAGQQLYRLQQKEKHQMHHDELEKHILRTLQNIQDSFGDTFSNISSDSIKLYIDYSDREEYDNEIYMDINLHHYPLRDYCGMWNTLQSTVKSYDKLGKRNEKALEHNKIAKHMMHLVRLYLMCFDILEKHEINTYREKEHDELMEIRNGKYLTDNDEVIPEFYDMVNDLEKKLQYDANNTDLNQKPDYKKINEWIYSINERIVKDTV